MSRRVQITLTDEEYELLRALGFMNGHDRVSGFLRAEAKDLAAAARKNPTVLELMKVLHQRRVRGTLRVIK